MKSFINKSLGTKSVSLYLTLILCVAGAFISSCHKKVSYDVAWSVYGYVVDAENVRPIVNAKILLGSSIVDSTDTSGYYQYASWGGRAGI